FEQVAALADAAAVECGDLDIGRRVGEELMRSTIDSGISDFLVGSGSIEAGFELVANASTKLSTGRTMRLAESSDGHVVIEGVYGDVTRASRFYCSISAGFFAQLPSLFGGRGAVAEIECQLLGHSRCAFLVVWDEPSVSEGLDGVIADSRARSAETIARLEQLHKVGSELANANDIDMLLSKVIDGADTVLRAPRHLLAVRVGEPPVLRVHSRGYSEKAAARAAEQLLEGDQHDGPSMLAVSVESPRRCYGRLVASFAADAVVTEVEHRLLSAYAGHVVAALERIESLESARRERDAAQALLELARVLAVVGTSEEVAERLALAVPRVTGCDEVSVWLWDEETSLLRLGSWVDADGNDRARGQRYFSVDDMPGLANIARVPRPFVIEATSADPLLRAPMEEAGLTHAAVVPVAARGQFLGLVSAGFRGRPSADHEDALFRILAGLADHGATALDNSRLVEHIRHQALHDALTGLPNRPLMEDRATQALRAAERKPAVTAVLFIDLDRFKNVNDTLGHSAGDDLIRQVARRLGRCVRGSDTLARLGGDEFVILAPDLPERRRACELAERVIESLRSPFVVDGNELYISCSIGIATAPDDGATYGELLQHADAAMYEAKAQGRSTFALDSHVGATPKREMLRLESALHKALDNDELCVLYQPQVDLISRHVVGVEALVRWRHPSIGLVGPDVFIPVAEESGLIVSIDQWVRDQAFGQAARWAADGCPLRMAVNLSSREVRNPRLADDIAEALARHAIDPGLVELEITDRVVMAEEDLPARLHALKQLGVRLAIDYYGTGHSVLGRLQSCPSDTLKIDKSFVREIGDTPNEAPVVGALVAMAHRLDLELVAEGVETVTQASILRGLGCHLAQGYYFSRPVEPAQIVRRSPL
ncbi:MAG: EAL domain-containing protein, partial [Actinomycetota bacterium]